MSQMTIRGLYNVLSLLPGSYKVTNASNEVMSYRGYYDQLAIGWGETTVRKLSVALHYAVGKTFTGYKGGDYVMDWTTRVWWAFYGDTGQMITGVTMTDDGTVYLATEQESAWWTR